MHLFLLGFVMMIIFGAMAQLIPVVLEAGHTVMDAYYVIFPLLFVFDFWLMPGMLPH